MQISNILLYTLSQLVLS